MIATHTAAPAVADNAGAATLPPDADSSRRINLPAAQVERMTDRVLADELAIAVQELLDALTRRRWCLDCNASNVGGGARGGCPTCLAFLGGTRLVAVAKAVRAC